MSLNRYAKKRDANEAPIIDALEQAGFEVWPLDWPCDLAVRKSSWEPGRFQFLEVKIPTAKARKDQRAQVNFLQSTKTPIVRTPMEALKAVGAVQ